jgi:hypothetical protein
MTSRLAGAALVAAILQPGVPALAAEKTAQKAAATSPDLSWVKTDEKLWPLGMLEQENLAKKRPKAPFDLTGTWTLTRQPETGGFNFLPLPKLKPKAQALYDEGIKANAEGKAFMDDTGACWPAGMPKWWTRVWPIQIMQYPTGIVMIQGLFNAARWIYTDGRGHMNPELREPTYNGDSIGRWEGDTLVVDTVGFQPKRHWVMQGVPVSDQFHIVERIKMNPDKKAFTVELIMTDPENWEGEWRNTKQMGPVKGEDVVESHCLPDLNEHILATHAEHNER